MLREAKHVGIIELQFGARSVASRSAVTRKAGSIQRRRRPVSRVAALRGNVAMNQADARHTICFRRRRRVVTLTAGALVDRALVRILVARSRSHLRILIRRLVVLRVVLSDDCAWNRDRKSQS